MADPELPQAPGAKAAFHLGLWSLTLNAACGCFPVAFPLGIAAILQHGKAVTAWELDPDRYREPGLVGRVLGVLGMGATVLGVIWATLAFTVGIPAIAELGRRRSQPAASTEIHASASLQVLMLRAEGAVQEALRAQPPGAVDPEKLVRGVLAQPQMKFPQAENPYAPARGAFRLGDVPEADGEVTLDPRASHRDLRTGRRYPAVVIRGRMRVPGGGIRILEKIVPLD